mgnify:CR=1 FL=1|tara:strand:+ start:678 stop:1307 length:630 start_codon:yes stop_codon:yes gene_type:complete
MDMELDRIARDAARLLHDGSETTVQAAIAAARSAAGGGTLPPPSRGRVRRHLAAMQQQSMGADEFRRVRYSVLKAVEECMAGLHWAVEDLELRLAGRAAEGVVDGLEPVWMRVHSTVDDGVLCSVLEEQEFEVTGIGTLETRHGRMTRITAEAAEFDLVLLRCHHRSQVLEAINLVTGGPVALVELESFGRRIDRGLSDAGRDPSGETG